MTTATKEQQVNKSGERQDNGSSFTEKAKHAAENVKEKVQHAAHTVSEKADEAVSSTGKGIESVADEIRRHSPHEGVMGKAASGVAEGIDRTGEYLETHGVSGMVEDMTAVIKRHPIPAMLIGVGIGYMVARITRS